MPKVNGRADSTLRKPALAHQAAASSIILGCWGKSSRWPHSSALRQPPNSAASQPHANLEIVVLSQSQSHESTHTRILSQNGPVLSYR